MALVILKVRLKPQYTKSTRILCKSKNLQNWVGILRIIAPKSIENSCENESGTEWEWSRKPSNPLQRNGLDGFFRFWPQFDHSFLGVAPPILFFQVQKYLGFSSGISLLNLIKRLDFHHIFSHHSLAARLKSTGKAAGITCPKPLQNILDFHLLLI